MGDELAEDLSGNAQRIDVDYRHYSVFPGDGRVVQNALVSRKEPRGGTAPTLRPRPTCMCNGGVHKAPPHLVADGEPDLGSVVVERERLWKTAVQ